MTRLTVALRVQRMYLLVGSGLILLFLFSACSIPVRTVDMPGVEPSDSYSLPGGGERSSADWWKVFEDPVLDSLMVTALANNLTIKQGVARLKQYAEQELQAGTELLPPVDGNVDYSLRKESGKSKNDAVEMDVSISWEIDLWGRLGHERSAAEYDTLAAGEDLRDVALLISLELARTYFGLVEKRLERKLLEKQIETNRVFQQLTELRFSNGAASVVDVYQQRQLVSQKEADIYLVDEAVRVLGNRIHVLTGNMPNVSPGPTAENLPELPGLPSLGIPAELLQRRPDLRKVYDSLAAANHEVAAAVADRLPQLKIGGSAGFIDSTFFYSFFMDAFAALIDYGKRKSEVRKIEAEAEEKAAFYAQAYLEAVEEVENCLWREKYFSELLAVMASQHQLKKNTLRESRSRYMQGLSDYLPVLASLQTLQELEKEYLGRRLRLVENRLALYAALGGSVEQSLYGGEVMEIMEGSQEQDL